VRADWIPSPPCLSDKLADWQFLAEWGGEVFFQGRDVLDVGPFYGVEAFMFALKAKRYTVLDSVAGVLTHIGMIAPCTERIDADAEKPWPISEMTFDTVLDFSTFDDLVDPLHGYREAYRVLNEKIAFQTYQYPHELTVFLQGLGFKGVRTSRTSQARAMIVGAR